MAKKKSKAQHIRDFIAEHKKQHGQEPSPSQVLEGLKAKGIRATAQAVYQVRSADKRNEGKAKARHTRKRTKQRRNKQVSVAVESLQATKKLADQLGGIDKLREHVAVLAELVS